MESLDFDKLVTAYYENLNTKLRNFYTGPEFLDSWVHDDNLNRSLFGLFESASDNGVEELQVNVSENLSKDIDLFTLQGELNELGNTQINHEGNLVKITMRKIHPAYKNALQARKIAFEGKLEGATSEAREGRLVLRVKVSNEGIIQDAKHEGGFGFFRPLLDGLCEILIGRPLAEGLDHAVIRLETSLRDPKAERPVKGLLTPENGDPAFKVLQSLLRKIPCDREARNEWMDGPQATWASLSLVQQRAKLEELLKDTGLNVIEIRHHTRIVLTGDQFRISPNAGHELMVLEKKAKETLDPSLEFVLESLEDKNKREGRTAEDVSVPAKS